MNSIFAITLLSAIFTFLLADENQNKKKLTVEKLTREPINSPSSDCYKNCVKKDGLPSDCVIDCFGTDQQKGCASKCRKVGGATQVKTCFEGCMGS